MNAKDYIKKICTHGCIYYTAATFLILFLYFLLNADLSDGIQAVALICILPFSLLFATANVLFRYADKLALIWRGLLHCALTLSGAFTCLYLPNKDPAANASQGLILFFVMAVVYVIIMGTLLGVRARIHRVRRDESRYTGVYREESPKKAKKSKPAQQDYQNVFKK